MALDILCKEICLGKDCHINCAHYFSLFFSLFPLPSLPVWPKASLFETIFKFGLGLDEKDGNSFSILPYSTAPWRLEARARLLSGEQFKMKS